MMEVAAVGFAELLLVVLLGAGGSPFPAGVPPLEEDPALIRAVPAESILFVEWFGTGTPRGESTNATERLAANEEVRHLVRTVLEAVQSAIRRSGTHRSPSCRISQSSAKSTFHAGRDRWVP